MELTVLLRDTNTGTLWFQKPEGYQCAICLGQRSVCVGCSGMSVLYPDLFGSCGKVIPCPNCVTHRPPDSNWNHKIKAQTYLQGTIVSWNPVQVRELADFVPPPVDFQRFFDDMEASARSMMSSERKL